MTGSWYARPSARAWRSAPLPDAPLRFHRARSGYAPTRLVELPALAAELGVGRVFVKEERERFGLPAFKMLGADYAVERARRERPDIALLVAATDGNHGRAVARAARLRGLPARIYFPASISAAAQAAIASEGAETVALDLPYDEVVAAAVRAAAETPGAQLVQDGEHPGGGGVAGWIVEGYGTILAEAQQQLLDAGAAAPALVAVPVGVGTLAETVVRWARATTPPPAVLGVEPTSAPSVIAALEAGRPVAVPTGETVMHGLNCGTVAANAWPVLRDGLDAAVAIDDDEAIAAVHDLERLGVDAGPCGAASLAGVRAALRVPDRRAELGIGADVIVLLLTTESRAANPLPR